MPDNDWESKMVFNTAAINLDDRVHLLYRASDDSEKSHLGYASTEDGFNIDTRLDEPVFSPESYIDCHGVEDPRITRINDTLYITYTAYGEIPDMVFDRTRYTRYLPYIYQIGLTSISVDDFENHRWNFGKRIYPLPRVKDKNSIIFPELFNGKYVIYHRLEPHIWITVTENISDWCNHNILMSPQFEWEYFKIGAAAPPIKTEKGWLFIYHAVSRKMVYRLGFAFIDLYDPSRIIYRHNEPIFQPETDYEKKGVVPEVVFSCGAVLMNDTIFIYYGGADTVIGVATAPLESFYKLAGF